MAQYEVARFCEPGPARSEWAVSSGLAEPGHVAQHNFKHECRDTYQSARFRPILS